jgi:hypothetical protein
MGTTLSLRLATTGKLLFVAAVTCYLLGRIFAGPATPLEVVVYGATAAFGLEFLLFAWREFWHRA